MTGYGGDEARRQALDAGFDYHFVKPVNLDDLTRVLSAPSLRGQIGRLIVSSRVSFPPRAYGWVRASPRSLASPGETVNAL